MAGESQAWETARTRADGPRVLMATSLGMHATAVTLDSLIAVALTWRGARVDFLQCDAALPACQMIDHGFAPSDAVYARHGPTRDFCGVCTRMGRAAFAPLGLPVRTFTPDPAAGPGAASPEPDEHAHAGALRFFGRERLDEEAHGPAVARRYAQAGVLARTQADALMARERYDVVVAHHGIYVPQGPIVAAAKAAGARVVTWHPSYRRGRVIYQHDETYHRAMITEPEAAWDQPLSADAERALNRYLASRETGAQDWIRFQPGAPNDRAELERALELDLSKPTLLLLGNVAWDAKLHFPQTAFTSMTDWAISTVDWCAGRDDVQLIVRAHPGEDRSAPRARDRLVDAVRAARPTLPANVRLVGPESALNTYALAQAARAVTIYNTKMGVELAARGRRVAVAGDAWIRGKGFSADAEDQASYHGALETALAEPDLTASQRERARRYAFHFFFRRCIPIDALDAEGGWPLFALRPDAAARAKPGADAGLDAICAGVMNGDPFETPPSLLP